MNKNCYVKKKCIYKNKLYCKPNQIQKTKKIGYVPT